MVFYWGRPLYEQSVLFSCSEVIQEVLHAFLRHVLHDDDMCKVASESVIIIRCKVVFFMIASGGLLK